MPVLLQQQRFGTHSYQSQLDFRMLRLPGGTPASLSLVEANTISRHSCSLAECECHDQPAPPNTNSDSSPSHSCVASGSCHERRAVACSCLTSKLWSAVSAFFTRDIVCMCRLLCGRSGRLRRRQSTAPHAMPSCAGTTISETARQEAASHAVHYIRLALNDPHNVTPVLHIVFLAA